MNCIKCFDSVCYLIEIIVEELQSTLKAEKGHLTADFHSIVLLNVTIKKRLDSKYKVHNLANKQLFLHL